MLLIGLFKGVHHQHHPHRPLALPVTCKEKKEDILILRHTRMFLVACKEKKTF
jgi:hypothetical protein